jgi:protein-S-isoprenylcysteine O-methyltransferase Ste14
MDIPRQVDSKEATKGGGPLPGLLRPPIIFVAAILLGVTLNWFSPFPFLKTKLRLFGSLLTACAIFVFVFSLREFRRAGTSVRGSQRSTVIVHSGPYRFSRNPIYVSFVLLVLGLSFWLDNFWLLAMLLPAISVISLVVIPREERFLERNFPEQYPAYKAKVRRWL